RRAEGVRTRSLIGRSPEQHTVDPFEEALELFLVWRAQDEHAAAFSGREPGVVQIVAIERQQRAAELSGKAKVLDVGRATQPRLLEHEERVPAQPFAHETNEPCREVGVAVDTWRVGQFFGERSKLRR